jgi:hypothetical protein
MEESRHGSALRHSIGELVTCPFCLDMWVATGFVVGLIFVPRLTRLVAGTFTALAGADFLQPAYAWAQSLGAQETKGSFRRAGRRRWSVKHRPVGGRRRRQLSKKHLLDVARRLDVRGRSTMNKPELVDAIMKQNRRERGR